MTHGKQLQTHIHRLIVNFGPGLEMSSHFPKFTEEFGMYKVYN